VRVYDVQGLDGVICTVGVVVDDWFFDSDPDSVRPSVFIESCVPDSSGLGSGSGSGSPAKVLVGRG
jgi:hypothetical protein